MLPEDMMKQLIARLEKMSDNPVAQEKLAKFRRFMDESQAQFERDLAELRKDQVRLKNESEMKYQEGLAEIRKIHLFEENVLEELEKGKCFLERILSN